MIFPVRKEPDPYLPINPARPGLGLNSPPARIESPQALRRAFFLSSAPPATRMKGTSKCLSPRTRSRAEKPTLA